MTGRVKKERNSLPKFHVEKAPFGGCFLNLTQVFAGVVDKRLFLLLIVERLILQLGTLQTDQFNIFNFDSYVTDMNCREIIVGLIIYIDKPPVGGFGSIHLQLDALSLWGWGSLPWGSVSLILHWDIPPLWCWGSLYLHWNIPLLWGWGSPARGRWFSSAPHPSLSARYSAATQSYK